jgi:hypothetical protein
LGKKIAKDGPFCHRGELGVSKRLVELGNQRLQGQEDAQAHPFLKGAESSGVLRAQPGELRVSVGAGDDRRAAVFHLTQRDANCVLGEADLLGDGVAILSQSVRCEA